MWALFWHTAVCAVIVNKTKRIKHNSSFNLFSFLVFFHTVNAGNMYAALCILAYAIFDQDLQSKRTHGERKRLMEVAIYVFLLYGTLLHTRHY